MGKPLPPLPQKQAHIQNTLETNLKKLDKEVGVYFNANEKIKEIDKKIKEEQSNKENLVNTIKELSTKKVQVLNEISKQIDQSINEDKEKLRNLEEKEKVLEEKGKKILEAQTKSTVFFFNSIGVNPPQKVKEIEEFCEKHFPESDVTRTKVDSKILFKLKSFTPYEEYLADHKDVTKIDFSKFLGGFPDDIEPLVKLLNTATSVKTVVLPSNLSSKAKEALKEVRKDIDFA